jgi:predicted aconitase
MDYSALGYIIGKELGTTVPYIRGLGNPSLESMKALGAACATSGGIALWHGEDVTPEANLMKKYLIDLDKFIVSKEEFDRAKAYLSMPLSDPIIVLGCPHASLKELKEIAKRVRGKDWSGKLWVFTNRRVYDEAVEAGIINAIEDSGGRVYRDTCMVVAPIKEMGWTEVATNSFKAGHYMANMGMKTQIGSINELLEGK